MKRNTLFSFLAIAALGLVMAGPASAGSCTFTWNSNASTDAWRTPANWSTLCAEPGHDLPVAGDTAIIQAVTGDGVAPVIDTNDEAVTTLTINTGGVLTITGKKLTIDGSTQTFNGNLVLSNGSAKVEFTHTAATVTLSGSGGIEGQHPSAEISLNDSDLDSDVDIFGMMTVKEVSGTTSTFKNGSTGIVRADAAGTLLFAAGLALEDEAGALWKAMTDPDAVLNFKEAADLAGDFVLCADADLDFDAAIDTTGCFDESAANGWIRVAGTNFFCHDDDTCAGGSPACYSSDREFTGTCND